MIEVELRGFINKKGIKKIKNFLERNAIEKEAYDEVSIFFNTSHILTLGSFYTGVGRIQANQRKYKNGKVNQKIKLKLNKPSGHGRNEYELILENDGLLGFLEIMKRVGVTQTTFKKCKRCDYKLKDIEVALKLGHPLGDHFEIEKHCKSEKDIKKTTRELKIFLNKYNLKAWTPEEYKKIMRENSYKTPDVELDKGAKLLK
jgi:adenylate cyclase class IV